MMMEEHISKFALKDISNEVMMTNDGSPAPLKVKAKKSSRRKSVSKSQLKAV